MALLELKSAHFIGIGGIGLSGVAKILHSQGMRVSGSDIEPSIITSELAAMGIPVVIGQAAANIPADAAAVVFSSAVSADNPERQEAARRGLPVFSYAQALGEITAQHDTIAVSGTHGKSTTTAMIGHILLAAGLDPLILVGTRVPGFSHGNVHLGRGKIFIVEACEHEAQMLQLQPHWLVLTNLEPDHLDFYHNWENLQQTFRRYVELVAPEKIIANGDDTALQEILSGRPVQYFGQRGIVHWLDRVAGDGEQRITVAVAGEKHTLVLQQPGAFNMYNALAALTAAHVLGVDLATALSALAVFPGAWRRFERKGEYRGAQIISDYGHHPTAVKKTVAAAREIFPGQRLWLVFQPHQHHRTAALFADFVTAFDEPDRLIMHEIYGVPGRTGTEASTVSAEKLLTAVAARRPTDTQWYVKNSAAAAQILAAQILPGDVILIMGAGDIFQLADQLCLS